MTFLGENEDFSNYQIHFTSADSQLFLRLDAAELLTWVKEQSEEKSLNLTKFTEHFNNMSFWTRTLILQQTEAKVYLKLFKTKNKIETVKGVRGNLQTRGKKLVSSQWNVNLLSNSYT